MSDFIFSSRPLVQKQLTRYLRGIYQAGVPEMTEYHGAWGSLVVSRNLHQGFQAYETPTHLVAVIGAPVLTFADNGFLTSGDATAGTRRVFNRWRHAKGIRWDKDLSGPFVVLFLDKIRRTLDVITDLMSFIPVYEVHHKEATILGTHVDVLARTADGMSAVDNLSAVDFFLHGCVTYPYTMYSAVRQLGPATVHRWPLNPCADRRSTPYWRPLESHVDMRLDEAATAIRNGLQEYIDAVTVSMRQIGVFISGGEDSRAILSLLPKHCQRHAFCLSRGESRESRIARKAAMAYGADFKLHIRNNTRYLDVLPACSDLVGAGSQYTHVHTYGFHQSAGLAHYPAVFGGLSSDSFLKGARIRKMRVCGKFPFLPDIRRRDCLPYAVGSSRGLNHETVEALNERRQRHFETVASIRPRSASEWFNLWPISMNRSIANLHGNRRLFRSYEPFLAHPVVMLAAAVPQRWKLNRRLFHRTVKPLFQDTKYLSHANGWLPYYPWFLNMGIQGADWLRQQLPGGAGRGRDRGSWCDWRSLLKSRAWDLAVEAYGGAHNPVNEILTKSAHEVMHDGDIAWSQRLNLLQLAYWMQSRRPGTHVIADVESIKAEDFP